MSLTQGTADTLRRALATAVVVPVMPYQADGHPDWDTYAALTARLIDAGISVITPNENTGEFYALSQAEARQALETAAKVAGADGEHSAEILAGVGHDIALDALRKNDFKQAMKAWEAARRFEELRLADGSADNVSVVKEALAQLGLCRADVRPPSRLLPPHLKAEVATILQDWDLT
jgi:dihydrodipicolinate synthase/N-acetylneuraminate lyase